MTAQSHPDCHGPEGHTCQKPSGRICIEPGCKALAGTLWGPFWCPAHDEQRLDRISKGFDDIVDEIEAELKEEGPSR